MNNIEYRKAREARLSHERVRYLFNYDPLTGVLTNAVDRGVNGLSSAGLVLGDDQAGDDHIRVHVDGMVFLAHRLAWFWWFGKWPDDQLDHRDLNKRNNRLFNLREATDGGNRQNMPKQSNNSSGHIGVSWSEAHGRWRATIVVERKQRHLGWFADIETAIAARAVAKIIYHPFSAGNLSDGVR